MYKSFTLSLNVLWKRRLNPPAIAQRPLHLAATHREEQIDGPWFVPDRGAGAHVRDASAPRNNLSTGCRGWGAVCLTIRAFTAV